MNDASTDRNLLFGVLAVQMGFISRDDLIAAASAWAASKEQSLAEILVARGRLSTDDDRLLQRLLVQQMARRQQDDERSLSATWDVEQLRQDLASIDDEQIQASVARLPLATMGTAASDSMLPGCAAGSAEMRFEKQRFHDKGGLGEIHIASDRQIPREVAIKEIKTRYANVAESRDRFVQEAKITGALEHPGVVPVYAMGNYPDGRPYYAMRFVRGESLSKAISRYHKADPTASDPGSHRLEFRKLLGQFITVCQTVGYAHSRRVIHRDIKPDNIMLGRHGETLVVDWGLAKRIDDDEAAAVPTAEKPLPSAIRGSGSTLPGSVVGTPACMSPEQAAGRVDQVGPYSDIYSLGATLYRLLTGAFPFQGRSAIEDVTKGRFKPPREIKANVPRALEAICLKAMAHDPRERYQTADALAAEVERWLADEPVSAYREPSVQRALRTARRHKAPVAAAAGLAIAAVLVGAAWLHAESKRKSALLGGAQQNLRAGTAALAADDLPKALGFFVQAETMTRHRGGLADIHAKARAERENVEDRIRTREQFAELLDTVDRTLSEARFRTIFGELRSGRDLCRSIYADFIKGGWQQRLQSDELSPASVRRLQENVAEALMLLARAEVALAPPNAQASALRDAIGFLDKAEQLRSGQRAIYRLRVDCYQRLSQSAAAEADTERYRRSEPTTPFDYFLDGTDLRAAGDPTAAIAQYEKALQEDPDHVWSHIMLAVCWIELRQPLQALAAYDQAIRLRPRFAWAHAGKALALADVGDWNAAHAALNRAESIEPESYAVANNRGAVYLARATSITVAAPPQAKIKLIDSAIMQFERGRQLQPRYLGAVANLGSAHAERAAALQAVGEPEKANTAVAQAIQYYSQALEKYPRYLPALLGRGATRLRFGDNEAALQDLLAAQAVAPNDPRVLYRLASCYERRGLRQRHSNHVDEAVDDLHEAELYFGSALRYRPGWASALLGRGRARHSLWQLSAQHADTDVDPAVAEQALEDLNAAETLGRGALSQQAFADLYGRRADLKAAGGREDEATVDYQLALDRGDRQASLRLRLGWVRLLDTQAALNQFEQALTSADELDPVQRAEAHNGRGHALASLGKDDQAVADAEAAVRLVDDRWQVLFNAAGIYGLATGIAAHERQDEQLAESRAARTIELLQQAIAAGLTDTETIRRDRSFVALVHRPDYQQLLE